MIERAESERQAQAEAAMAAERERFEQEWATAEGRFNVMIAGASGVGKSTIINQVFGFDDNDARSAREGVGPSTSMNIEPYSVPGKPITIFDTRGFELKSADPRTQLYAKVREMRASPSEADHLHVAWLCLRQDSARFEELHEEFVKRMKEVGVPVVVVVTNSYDDAGEIEAYIKGQVGLGVHVVNVLARSARKGKYEFEARGLNDLLSATLHVLPEGRQTALIAAQKISGALKEEKEKKAREAILSAAAAAVVAAMSPIPGSSLVGVSAVQAGLMARLDKLAGLESAGMMDYAKLAGIALARSGGGRLAALAVSQLLKFVPGLGTAAGDAINAGMAGTMTTALGYAYWTAAKLAGVSGQAVNIDTLTSSYTAELAKPRQVESATA